MRTATTILRSLQARLGAHWDALRRRLGGRRAANAAEPDEPEGHRLGVWGEQVAAEFLKTHGYRIVGRRVQVGRDELDIVAVPPGPRRPPLVFVEVKTRRSTRFGGPIAALNRRKRHALCRAAARYLRRLPPPATAFRFDAVEVIGEPEMGPPTVRHTENVFPMETRYVTPWLGCQHGRSAKRR